MTSALYADSQAAVKDIYFCVAKQQLLDSHQKFYLIHCGTDRLEMDFCHARTQNHHRNFDILDLAGKLAMSSLIDLIFVRNPTLDAGSRRLKVTGVVGVDHLNPKSWIGDVSVGKVSLQWCWEEGRKQAAQLISSLYPGDPVADFEAAFCLDSHDLLRPGGRYVGFSAEADPLIADDQLDDTAVAETHSHDGCGDDGEDGFSDNDAESSRDDMDLEDLLPDSTDNSLDSFYNRGDEWLEIDGQQYLKSSLVTQHLKANCSKKVVERTLRCPTELPVDPDGDNFQVGDLAVTLVRTDSLVCLAIIQAIGICKDQNTHHVVKTEALYDSKEGYTVQVEVLRIVQASSDMWAWPPHDFVKVSKPTKQKTKTLAVKDFALSVPGFLCHRISPQSLDATLPCDSETWAFDATELLQLVQSVWSDFRPENEDDLEEKTELLPRIWSSGGLPYTDQTGTATFVIEGFSLNGPDALNKEATRQCPLCNKQKKLKAMRDHIGHHVLSRLHKVSEDPCDFCGGGPCNTTLTITGDKKQVKSNCRFHCPFKYGSAKKSLKASPCTNVPVKCPQCSKTIWKYNAAGHITVNHPESLFDNNNLDPRFILEAQISDEEGTTMGISNEAFMEWRAKYPNLFPQGGVRAVIKARAQGTQNGTKRWRL
ncbi:hypothetical protein BJ322DRAFT_1018049 [Thelephora terrestris]|uniref:Uncharacterized protein n=1 Tax=Thelephora terrestris TaxID=56493 RepID=A0A9P6HL38_9AGAM|nr:hypothetical protein BJ322DRAFT_1018049 [Thelephora terrestris]